MEADWFLNFASVGFSRYSFSLLSSASEIKGDWLVHSFTRWLVGWLIE